MLNQQFNEHTYHKVTTWNDTINVKVYLFI